MTSIETRQSWAVAVVVLVIMGLAFGAAWITTVALTEIAKEVGGSRAIPSLAISLTWFGSGIGGIFMGRMYRRYGARALVIWGVVMIATGLAISTIAPPGPLLVGHALFLGVLGLGAINAPMYLYISQWFDRRRGSALALISSGGYLAGSVWPPIFERAIGQFGWRQTMLMYGGVLVVVAVPLAVVFLNEPPKAIAQTSEGGQITQSYRIGLPPNVAFGLLCVAAVLCCIPMAMPQQHLVAFCGDLGIGRATGALMLSVLLGAAVVSRQLWGLASDRLGGLKTLVLSSGAQAIALSGFLLTQSEAGLFVVAGAFGLGFSALIPAYALTVRELFDSEDAYWRMPTVLFCTGSGMAIGGWLAGALYDGFLSYQPAFAVGVASNVLNFTVIGFLLSRQVTQVGVAGRA